MSLTLKTDTSSRPAHALFVAGGLLLSPLISGCNGCNAPSDVPQNDPRVAPLSPFFIHMYAGPEHTPISFAPGLRDASSDAIAQQSSDQAAPYGSGEPIGHSRQALTISTDGGTEYSTSDNSIVFNARSIIRLAAGECGAGGSAQNPLIPPPAIQEPWANATDWFIFPRAPTSCDELVAYEEALVCTASKLNEIAESVGTISWNKAPGLWVGVTAPYTIPPQSTADRFIVRDLAIWTLAHVARLDTLRITEGPNKTCSQQYAEAMLTPSVDSASVLFGQTEGHTPTYFPPSTAISNTSIPSLAKTRLMFEAHSMRAGARLLEHMIRAAVTDDVAAAARRRAVEPDPVQGNLAAWGNPLEQDVNKAFWYDSYNHALRILTQRWDEDNYRVPSLDCSWSSNLPYEYVPAFNYGPDLGARIGTRPAETPGERAAVALLEGVGIVVPAKWLVSTNATGAAIRSMIERQLEYAAGLNPDLAADATTAKALAIHAQMMSMRDEDLRYALQRNFASYRMLTNSDDKMTVLSQGQIPGGLIVAPRIDTAVTSAGGTVIDGGLPLADLGIDFLARGANMSAVAQCSYYGDGYGETNFNPADAEDGRAMQDVFSIGQTFYRRLVQIRRGAARAGDAATEVGQVAAEAAAETNAWAGPGWVTGTTTQVVDNWGELYEGAPVNGGIIELQLDFVGLDADGISGPVTGNPDLSARLQNEISVVWGAPWVADCAAGLRKSCPADIGNYIAHPYAISDIDATKHGADGYPVRAKVKRDAAWPFFVPSTLFPYRSDDPAASSSIYIVVRNSRTGRGRVLGALRPRWRDEPTTIAVSDMYRGLLRSTVGFDDNSTGCGTRQSQESDPGLGAGYCIDGIPRNLFVPLANELTSDTDQYENSWKHYLTLASEAATTADTLGQKLIDEGIKQDLRSEEAGDKVAKICGEYGTLGGLDYSSGTVKAGADNASLGTCTDEQKIPVVAFTTDFQPAEASAMLGCPSSGDTLCTQFDAEGKPKFRTETLRFFGGGETSGSATSNDPCQNVRDFANSLSQAARSDALRNVANEGWLDLSALNGLQLDVDTIGGWTLRSAGAPVMSTTDTSVWPACTTVPNNNCCRYGGDPKITCPSGPNGLDKQADLFDIVFRGGVHTPFAQSDSSTILWRVEGALWTAYAMLGSVPEGAFNVPVPAVNFYNENMWIGQNLDEREALAAIVYGSSRFDPLSGSGGAKYVYFSDSGSRDEQASMSAVAVPSTFTLPHSAGEAPEWINALAGQIANLPGRYVLLPTRNPEVAPRSSSDPPGSQPFDSPGDNLPRWIRDAATEFSGTSCSSAAVFGSGAVRLGSLRSFNKGRYSVAFGVDNVYSTIPAWTPIPRNGTWFSQEYPDSPTARLYPADYDVLMEDPLNYKGWWAGNATFFDCVANVSSCPNNPCPYPNNGYISNRCAQDAPFMFDNGNRIAASVWGKRLQPRHTPKEDRQWMFLNWYPPADDCRAAAQLAGALALACSASGDFYTMPTTTLPPVTSARDLPGVEKFVAGQIKKAEAAMRLMHLRNVPASVYDALIHPGTPSPNHGERGNAGLELRTSIERLANVWRSVPTSAGQIVLAIQGVEAAIKGIKFEEDANNAELLVQGLQVTSRMVEAAMAVPTLDLVAACSRAANATIQVEIGMKELEAYTQIARARNSEAENKILLALIDFEKEVSPQLTSIQNALGEFRGSVASINAQTEAIAQLEDEARYEAAKGGGAPFTTVDGKVVDFPINRVYATQYDVTSRRYQAALQDAKRYAYMARLAIEQRFGVRLGSIRGKVGGLEAPATWADDICRVTGVDYEKYRQRTSPVGSGGVNASQQDDVLDQFADQFVGGYVAKLESFVENFNLEHPSHDGDDVAVLSLRDDLLASRKSCSKQSPNLLYYSDELQRHDAQASVDNTAIHGWITSDCPEFSTFCSHAKPGGDLQDPLTPPDGVGKLTWLVGVPSTTSVAPSSDAATDGSSDANGESGTDAVATDGGVSGVDASDAGGAILASSGPTGVIWQKLTVSAGTYVLSWWDQARTATGYLATSGAVPYRVGVFDANGLSIKYVDVTPFIANAAADPPELWGPRASMTVSLSAGTYFVGFAPSTDLGVAGSVAIANVQLEAESGQSGPTKYVRNEASTSYVSSDCGTSSSSALRTAFARKCDPNGACYYELAKPIVIDTGAAQTGGALWGRLAAGNYNYRHVNVAINLVGTGLRDCSRTPTGSCYGSGFVDYTLTHDGAESSILGFDGVTQCFDFGVASINHGKAIAAERMLTLPLGSADQSILAQPQVQKEEFRGRPLDGRYLLRIWDQAELDWDRLEDVQLVLTYRYWSAIQTAN